MHWIRAKLLALRENIVKEQMPAGFIARGWALGVFIGCVVPFGFQVYLALPLAFLFRCSKIGALTGTLISNPVTILFLYPAQCWVGSRLLGNGLSWGMITESLDGVLLRQEWSALMELSGHLIASFFAGGLLLAVVAAPVAYYIVHSTVCAYRRRIGAISAKASATA